MSKTREFDFYFCPQEVGVLSATIVPPPMIIVCKELAAADIPTLFNLNQALQYGSVGGVYFRSDVSSMPVKQLSRSDGSRFFLIDDMALPEHLGVFAHRSIPPALPRVSISLASSFLGNNVTVVPTSVRITHVFDSIRSGLKAKSIPLKWNGLDVLVSDLARELVARGEATTGNVDLDTRVKHGTGVS